VYLFDNSKLKNDYDTKNDNDGLHFRKVAAIRCIAVHLHAFQCGRHAHEFTINSLDTSNF